MSGRARIVLLCLALGAGSLAAQENPGLRGLLRRAGQPDSLALSASVGALFGAPETSWELELAHLFAGLSDSLQLEVAFVCGQQGTQIELLTAITGVAAQCPEDELFLRSSLAQAAYSLARRNAENPSWLQELQPLLSRSETELRLLAEVLTSAGGPLACGFLAQAIGQPQREWVAYSLPRLALPAVEPGLLPLLADVAADRLYPAATRCLAVERLAAPQHQALAELVRCFARVDAQPASADRDIVHRALHQALIATTGRDLGDSPRRWLLLIEPQAALVDPAKPMLPASFPAWLASMAVCAALALLTGALLLWRPAAIAPFLSAPLALLALVFAWRDVLADAARVWSHWGPSASIVGLSVLVGIEVALLARRRPWLQARKPAPASGPRIDSELGEALDAVKKLVDQKPQPAPAPAAPAGQASTARDELALELRRVADAAARGASSADAPTTDQDGEEPQP